jgi:hypothetical protein
LTPWRGVVEAFSYTIRAHASWASRLVRIRDDFCSQYARARARTSWSLTKHGQSGSAKGTATAHQLG